MKLRTTDPWMPAPEYARSLHGLRVNLIVASIERSLRFQREVLGAEVVYSDPDFAVLRGPGDPAHRGEWMLHADRTYERYPLRSSMQEGTQRGIGIEREAYLLDTDGYCWVADVPAIKPER